MRPYDVLAHGGWRQPARRLNLRLHGRAPGCYMPSLDTVVECLLSGDVVRDGVRGDV